MQMEYFGTATTDSNDRPGTKELCLAWCAPDFQVTRNLSQGFCIERNSINRFKTKQEAVVNARQAHVIYPIDAITTLRKH